MWAKRPTLISDKYALALGHFIMCWNLLEQTLMMIQWGLFKGDTDAWTAAYAGLSNQARCDITLQLVDRSQFSPEARELVKEFVTQYSIVNENRNVLMHSVVHWEDKGIRAIKKFSKAKLGQFVQYSYSLSDIQKCLEEGERTLIFGNKTLMIELQNAIHKLTFKADEMNGKHAKGVPPQPKSLPLPKKPPRPSKLKPLDPEGRPDGGLQPLSFSQ